MKRNLAIACTAVLALGTPALAIAATEATNVGSYATWDFTTPDVQPAGVINHTSGASGTFKFGVLNAPDGTFKIVKTTEDFEEMTVETSADEYFSPQSPFGSAFGASGPSTSVTFLKVRLDGTKGTATTTFTFDSAMPAGAFGAAFGDLDFDTVTVDATNASNAAVSGADLNGSTFNLCNVTDSIPSICSGATLFTPSWDATTRKFTVNEEDSDGATGMINPTSSIKSITTLQETGSGGSSIRTWFAVKSAVICGTVKGLAASTASLTLSYGKTNLASVTTGEGGTYCFPKALAVKGYTLKVKAPEGMTVKGSATADVTLAKGNVVKDFTVQVTPTTTVAEELPETGNNANDSLTLVASLSLLAGTLFVFGGRARRRYN